MAESIIATKKPLKNLNKGQYLDWDCCDRGFDASPLKSLTDA